MDKALEGLEMTRVYTALRFCSGHSVLVSVLGYGHMVHVGLGWDCFPCLGLLGLA